MQNSQNPWGRLIRGLGANAFGQVVTAGIQIISVPVFLKYWGVHQYGDWLILVAIPTYLALSDLGFGSVAANEMTMLVAKGEHQKALSIFQSTWILISFISGIIAVTLSATIFSLPIEQWLNLSTINHLEAVCILLLMILHLLVGQQRILINAGFRCEGNYPVGVLYENLLRLTEFGIVSLGISQGATPLVAAVIFLCIRILGTFGTWFDLRQKSPWLHYGYKQADVKVIKSLFIPASAYMGFPLGEALSIQGMTIAIGSLLGSASVVTFSTLRTVSRVAWQLLRSINYAVWPELSIAFGKENWSLARNLHTYSCKTALWLTFVILPGLALFGRQIISTWTAGQVSFDATLFNIMLLVILANSLWSTSQMVPLAVNQHQKIAFVFAMSCLFSLVLAVGLMPHLGINGAAISLLLIDTLMIFVVIKKSLDLLNESLKNFLFQILSPPSIKRTWSRISMFYQRDSSRSSKHF
jgi:O-antigen/teichoic acid export membrane protein